MTRHRRLFLGLSGVFVLLSFVLILVSQQALALAPSPLVYRGGDPQPGRPNPSASSLPPYISSHLADCDSTPNTPAFGEWISPANAPTSGTATVGQGAASVALQYNYAGAYCRSGSEDLESVTDITSVSASPPGTFAGIAGATTEIYFPGPAYPAGTYDGSNQQFTFYPTGGFATSGVHVYTIYVTFKNMNHFSDGIYSCVNGGSTNAGGFNFNLCDSATTPMTITIDVTGRTPPPPPPSTINVDGYKIETPSNNPVGPFSAATIHAHNTTDAAAIYGSANNPYFFTGIPAGSYTFTDQTAAPTNYTLLGFTYCDDTHPPAVGCTDYMINPANVNANGATVDMENTGDEYSMRWLYSLSIPVSATCNLTTSSSRIEADATGNTFTATLSYSGSNPTAGTPIKVTVAGQTFTGSASGGSTDTITEPVPSSLTASDYPVTWSISSLNLSGTCDTLSLYDLPYFSVYGAGISALTGAGYINSWFNNENAGYGYGSSSQFNALSLNPITGFASAQTLANRSPIDLTFANTPSNETTNAQTPILGGDYGGTHAEDVPSAPGTAIADNGATIPNLGLLNGAYTDSSPNVAVDASTVGTNVALFVKGNVYISGNIIYGPNWTLNNVPSATIVAEGGNIYLAPGVSEVDGEYVAVPTVTGTEGNIYTCATGFTAMSSGSLFSGCNKQLTVYGSFVGGHVYLMRAFGTLSDAASGTPTLCHNNGGRGSSRPTCAAEVFDFSPEMYLGSQPTSETAGGYQINSVTSLPPVL